MSKKVTKRKNASGTFESSTKAPKLEMKEVFFAPAKLPFNCRKHFGGGKQGPMFLTKGSFALKTEKFQIRMFVNRQARNCAVVYKVTAILSPFLSLPL